MYFALMILLAILAVALVLFMERRGDPRLLEREYRLRANSSQAKDSLESGV
ncbi:MAG: hypothetical protein M3362_23860 [Acidobacteriota bacterium]|nr:hypothetical protein [Acidobacteriota bacterium]